MLRAIARLRLKPEHVLIDGPLVIPGNTLPQRAIVDGDATCASIAAASIVAKVARDEVMCGLDRWYPEYGFASHKGYATSSHLRQIEMHGLCPQHRRSWAAVARRSRTAVRRCDGGARWLRAAEREHAASATSANASLPATSKPRATRSWSATGASREGEIDIIAAKPGEIIFVEVRSRRGTQLRHA